MLNLPPLRAVVYPLSLAAVLSLALRAEDAPAPRTLSLDECLSRAAARSLQLKASALVSEAAAARARQAARRINPTLAAEVENVAGNGDQSGLRAAETTLSLAQEIELGGKRQRRVEAAQAEAAARRADEAALRHALLAETRQAAVSVLAAQERVRCADEILALAREAEAVACAREAAGKTTALDTERARSDTAHAALDVAERQSEQREAVYELALSIGESEPSFDRLSGALEAPPADLPSLDALVQQAASHPSLLAAEAEAEALDAQARSAQAEGAPNLEVTAGVRRFEESDGYGFVAGVGVGLPIYNLNRDAARAAQAAAEAAKLQAAAARLKNDGAVRRLYDRLRSLAARELQLRESVVPSAERALSLVAQGHAQGKAGYLDVIEARRALAEARLGLIDARAHYQASRAALDERASAAAFAPRAP